MHCMDQAIIPLLHRLKRSSLKVTVWYITRCYTASRARLTYALEQEKRDGESCGRAKWGPTDLNLAFDWLVGVHLKGVAGEVDLAVEHHELLLQALFLLGTEHTNATKMTKS